MRHICYTLLQIYGLGVRVIDKACPKSTLGQDILDHKQVLGLELGLLTKPALNQC